MHVVYIHQHFATPRDALGTRSYELSQRLIAGGHEVTMICGATTMSGDFAETAERVTEEIVDGIKVLRVNESYSNSMGFMDRVFSFTRFAATAGRLATSCKGDVVFATSTPLTVGIPGVIAKVRSKAPFVFEVRDLWPDLPIAMGAITNPAMIFALRRLERFTYRRADHIVALAPGMKEGVIAAGYPADRISTIPNGCDTVLFQVSDEPLTDARFAAGSDGLRIVYPGVLGNANGLDDVFDALAVLRKRNESGIHLHLIGGGGEKDHLLERHVADRLEDYVTFHAPIPKEELAKVLPRFDVGLMTLRNVPEFHYGTSPNKFFDFLAAGLPVLNNYPGWVAGMIEKAECGVVVEAENPEALADAMVEFRNRRSELPAMGKRSRMLAETEFSRDLLGRQFVDMLTSVVSKESK